MGVWLINFIPVPYTPKLRYIYILNTQSGVKNNRVFSLYMHDYTIIPAFLWGNYFVEAQDYIIDHDLLLQGKKLIILLATNGQMSSSKKI